MVRDFCFWSIWAAGPVHKKKLGADYEQLLSALFSCFHGQFFFKFFYEHFSVSTKKLHNEFKKKVIFKKSIWNKIGFLGLRKFSNVNVLHKDLLLQDWVFRLGVSSTFYRWTFFRKSLLFNILSNILTDYSRQQ